MRRQTDAGKRSAVKVACCVWRGAHGKVPLPGRQLVGCLPYRVEHSTRYDGPGCYHLAGEGLHQQQVQEALKLDPNKSSLQPVDDLFCGYYFIAEDGTVCGLCTGMRVRLR